MAKATGRNGWLRKIVQQQKERDTRNLMTGLKERNVFLVYIGLKLRKASKKQKTEKRETRVSNVAKVLNKK